MAGAETLHASAVAFGDQGVLIRGASGSGKSALALALIARGAHLISDDRTVVRPGSPPVLGPPPALAGLIEARGVGLIRTECWTDVPLTLLVDLDRGPQSRLPEPHAERLHGWVVPLIMGKGCPGLADTLSVLVQNGQLVDPRNAGPGDRSAE